MKITWLGHASFRIEVGNQVLLLDPWLKGKPSFDEKNRAAAIRGATHILANSARSRKLSITSKVSGSSVSTMLKVRHPSSASVSRMCSPMWRRTTAASSAVMQRNCPRSRIILAPR